MISNVSKKYTKALMDSFDESSLEDLLKNLKLISSAFKISKFKDIINSPVVTSNEKISLVLSFLKNPDEKFEKFLRILSDNSRLDLIPEITESLRKNIATINSEFIGKIYAKDTLDESKITMLQNQLSQKFGSKIILEMMPEIYNGIKIEIEDLGYEISFSSDRLRSKMSEYILKAI